MSAANPSFALLKKPLTPSCARSLTCWRSGTISWSADLEAIMMSSQEPRNGINLAEQEAYWKETLRGELPVFDFHDPARPPVQSFVRGQILVELDEEVAHGVRLLALKENV